MAYRYTELDKPLLGIVKEVRQCIGAFNTQKALVLRRSHLVVPVAQNHLIGKENEV